MINGFKGILATPRTQRTVHSPVVDRRAVRDRDRKYHMVIAFAVSSCYCILQSIKFHIRLYGPAGYAADKGHAYGAREVAFTLCYAKSTPRTTAGKAAVRAARQKQPGQSMVSNS